MIDCPSCGANLKFDPKSQRMLCDFCGSSFDPGEFDISEDAISRGIANTEWFGRFSVIRENPYVIIDGGHNRQGAAVLRKSLEEYFPASVSVSFSVSEFFFLFLFCFLFLPGKS